MILHVEPGFENLFFRKKLAHEHKVHRGIRWENLDLCSDHSPGRGAVLSWVILLPQLLCSYHPGRMQ